MMVQPPQAHNHEKYDNNGKGWYFRFDDDNKMIYKYIPPSISLSVVYFVLYSPLEKHLSLF